jgi:hypothetical protein
VEARGVMFLWGMLTGIAASALIVVGTLFFAGKEIVQPEK